MLDGFDFDAAVHLPFRMQPGLRRIASGRTTLTPAAPGSRHQREKLAVLSAMPDEALVCHPGFDPQHALDLVCRTLAADHPTAFMWSDDRFEARRLGVAVDSEGVHVLGSGEFGLGDELPRCLRKLDPAWRLTGLLALALVEDLAIVDGTQATVPWMAVCLPSRWIPREKVGRHFTAIHDPVADNDTLLKAGEHLMRLACRPEPYERFVWNVTDHPRLNAHPGACDPESWLDPTRQAHGAWFRSEHQRFLPLPTHHQAVFAIGVDVVTLEVAIAVPGRAWRLHQAVESMSAEVLAYRRLDRVREPLLAWLRERAGEHALLPE